MLDLFTEVNERPREKLVDINIQNKNGEGALHLCCRNLSNKDITQTQVSNMIQLVKYLVLKCGANTNLKNSIGDSPLDIAQRSQNSDLLVIFS